MREIPKASSHDLRSFGLATGLLAVALFGLLLPWLREVRFPGWPFVCGAILVCLALGDPRTLAPVYRLWIRIGGILGWFNTRVLLGAVFLFVVTPVVLAMRLAGRDALRRKFDPDLGTYRVPSTPPNRDKMERPF